MAPNRVKPMKSIASLVRPALLAWVASSSLLCGALQAYAEVGVAAAVNVDAKGRPPGGSPRVISLGSNVVFNEEITTDGAGLVQILLLDGTTFTVGPNSQLTIDEFVYNPNSGEAKVVASLSKGVFRFVGARTSQTEGGAVVKTPVGTIGIRGAVTNISYDPSTGESTAALVAGNKLTITDGDGTQRIVYETGYTAVITKDRGGGTTTTVRKSTAAETRAFQQQLAGKSGQNGGTSNPPTDETVEQSQVGDSISGLPDTMDVPGSTKPVQSSEPDQAEDVAGIDGKTQDDLDNDIAEEQQQPNARVLTAPTVYNAYFGASFADAGVRGLVGSTTQNDQLVLLSSQAGRLGSSNGTISLPDFSGIQGNEGLESLQVTDGQSPLGPVSGIAYAGADDFVAYLLGFNGDPTQPYYVLYGTPTGEGALISMETGFNIREYTLTEDPIQEIPATFFSNELYGGSFEAGTFNSTNMFLIEPANSETADVRGFQTWISIEDGVDGQKSAIFVNASNVYRDEDAELILSSGRRGSFRYDDEASATNLRGGIGTLPGASGVHFFGSDANHFVIGTPIDPADTYFDSNHSGALNQNTQGYLSDGNFATHHVGSLIDNSPQSEFDRTLEGRMDGFMAGMGETEFFGGSSTYRLTSDGSGPNMYVSFNPEDNAFAARGTVYDSNNDDDLYYEPERHLQNILLTFGHYTDEETDTEHFGQGTYVDANNYGAMQNNSISQTAITTDDDVPHDEFGFGAGSYIVSGRASPIEGYEHIPDCTDCEFIQWGWWGTRVQTDLDPGAGEEIRTDYVHMGTWVAGDIVDPDELPETGGATFVGHALGTVARDNGDGVAQYIARGDAQIGYDFSTRQAEIAITDFDGMDVSGVGFDASTATQTLYSGSLADCISCGPGGPELTGSFSGAIVGPNNVAAGTIGDFSFSGTNLGNNVSAAGTFAATQAF